MSISSTLANALTGLTAASRSAQVVSSNVSNAVTEGYARREIELSARGVGGAGAGVRVDGIVRIVDETLLRERRLASAAVGSADAAARFQKDALDLIGQPEDPSSLAARVVGLETALLTASSRPDSEARLSEVLTAAQDLTGKLNDASDQIQVMREDADQSIDYEVRRLNSALEQIAELNGQILRAKGSDRDYPSLLDSRQKLIDEISEVIPIRQLPRENDTVALYSMNGALLLDIEPAEFAFSATAPITPDMTQTSAALSGLTINGIAVNTAGNGSPIDGGRLAGLFQVRDELAITVQDNLDTIARDIMVRFEDLTLDTTLLAGVPGLFTDGGSALNPLDVVGLAARISVNSLVDPVQGGATWRLRDGLGAVSAGAVGDATLLDALSRRLLEPRSPVGGTFSPALKSVADFAASLTSLAGQALQAGNDRLSFEQARYAGLDDALVAQGVDTDQEMQKLLLIEQAYAANARVIQTADELIQLLIGL